MFASRVCTVMTTVLKDWLLYCGLDMINSHFQKTSSCKTTSAAKRMLHNSHIWFRSPVTASSLILTHFLKNQSYFFFPKVRQKFLPKGICKWFCWVGTMSNVDGKSLLSQWLDIMKRNFDGFKNLIQRYLTYVKYPFSDFSPLIYVRKKKSSKTT